MVCSPARVSLLTGLFPERIFPVEKGISPEIVTLPEVLKEEGYTTWHIGKWHIGDILSEALPDRQGFDHWLGFHNQYRLAGTHQNGEVQYDMPTYLNPWLEGDTEPGRNYEGHLETILTAKAIQVISDLNKTRAPWFVNLWFFAPHQPWTPASEFAKNYPADPAGRYRALVNQLDTNIGRILDHLEAIGALENTIVVVVSDNGGTNTSMDNNAPFYGAKRWLFEGSLRTPLIIRFPDELINGQVFSQTISIADIFPTLLAAIGVALPEGLDGKSFYRALQHLEPAPQKELYWEIEGISSYGGLSADGRWRYYKLPAGFFGGTELLYDLQLDPTGAQVVAPEQPAQLTQMRENYQAWFKDIHIVKTVYTPGQNGIGTLTGTSFLRTPGYGPYTFGMGVPEDYSGSIVAQPGIWELSKSGNTVTAQFGSIALSGDIQETRNCHSIVVVGNFLRRASSNSIDKINLALYLDGVIVRQTEVDTFLNVPDVSVETIIGDPVGIASSEALSPPVILNTVLSASSPWTLDSFSKELCKTP